MFFLSFVIVVVAFCSAFVDGYLTCGDQYSETKCFGTGAYCCGMRNEECCWDNVTSFWWFWFSWFWVILIILSCGICICIRRRRHYANQPRYVIVEDAQANYGTVPQTYHYNAPMAGYAYTNVPSTGVATAPPSYQEKPPDYNTVAASN
ncbi:hypothetical protein ACF0H5_000892 [Mactra antiquata]